MYFKKSTISYMRKDIITLKRESKMASHKQKTTKNETTKKSEGKKKGPHPLKTKNLKAHHGGLQIPSVQSINQEITQAENPTRWAPQTGYDPTP